MKKTILILSALAFIACGKVEEVQKPTGEMKPVTDLNTCQGSTPMGLTVFSKSWRVDYRGDNGTSMHDLWKIEPSAVTLTRTCNFAGAEVAVVVRVNASVGSGTIQTLSHDEKQLTVKVGETEQICYAEIPAAQITTYSFQGPCLRTVTTGVAQVMVPQ